MRKILHKAGWLVVAAALMTGFASCSSEDNLTEEPMPVIPPTPTAKTLHISVGAGIDNGGTTRSTVNYNQTTKERTLQFTANDRLYVRGGHGATSINDYGDEYYDYVVAGYLTLDTESFDSSNPTTATFTGDLTVYELQENSWYAEEFGERYEYYYDDEHTVTGAALAELFPSGNPLGDCSDVQAVLVHEDAGSNFKVYSSSHNWYYENYMSMASDVETLMTTRLSVSGNYDKGTNSFSLSADSRQPILNCTISGLTPGTTYTVRYCFGSLSYNGYYKPMSTVTANSDGIATFACFGYPNENNYHALRFINTSDDYDWKLVDLGQKMLANKVYTVTKTAVDDPDTPVPPTYTAPDVYRIDSGSNDEMEPDENGYYEINGYWAWDEELQEDRYEGCIVYIRETSIGCRFYFNGEDAFSYVTLDNLTATYDGNYPFIQASDYLTLNIDGDNTITCKNMGYCIKGDRYIYLQGSGKLTLITNGDGLPIRCEELFINDVSISESDWPEGTQNSDGTWTFVFDL